MQVGPARARHAESAGLGSSRDPQLPEAESSSATRGEGRGEPSDGGCMSRSSAKIAPMVVMIGAALVLTSCTGEATDYSYPAYYYDGQAPYGGFDSNYAGGGSLGRFPTHFLSPFAPRHVSRTAFPP